MKVIFISFIFLLTSSLLQAQLLKVDSIMVPYKYLVHIPEKKAHDEKFPMLLFLHGSGERGDDINLVRIHNPVSIYKDSSNFPFLLVAPQCPAGQQWNVETLIWLLDEIEEKYAVDKDRIYLTGLSMGGHGTWKLAERAGERFAAIAPVCGWGDTATACLMRHLPVWAFHGDRDNTVLPDRTEKLIAKLQALGANAKLTMYPGVGHNSWNNAYADPELYKWLLSHKKFGNPIHITTKEKKELVGKYVYTDPNTNDKLDTYVEFENEALWYNVPRNGFRVKMYAISKDLFRLEGVPLQRDSELFFERDKKNKIIGQRYYPCDNTFVPKVESDK